MSGQISLYRDTDNLIHTMCDASRRSFMVFQYIQVTFRPFCENLDLVQLVEFQAHALAE